MTTPRTAEDYERIAEQARDMAERVRRIDRLQRVVDNIETMHIRADLDPGPIFDGALFRFTESDGSDCYRAPARVARKVRLAIAEAMREEIADIRKESVLTALQSARAERVSRAADEVHK